MRKLVASLSLVLLLATPLAASALSIDLQTQINDLLAQIKVLQVKIAGLLGQAASSTPGVGGNARVCFLVWSGSLGVGSSGDSVSALQEFLRDQGYLSTNATGYYGSLTSSAVARWQSAEGISAVGTFGPLSRERLKIWCNAGINNRLSTNPSDDPTCSATSDNCNTCTRSSPTEGFNSCTTHTCSVSASGEPLAVSVKPYCIAHFSSKCEERDFLQYPCLDGTMPNAVRDARGCITDYQCAPGNF